MPRDEEYENMKMETESTKQSTNYRREMIIQYNMSINVDMERTDMASDECDIDLAVGEQFQELAPLAVPPAELGERRTIAVKLLQVCRQLWS